MTLKKIFGKVHLWLGLATAPVIFITGITGAIYCFAPELQDLQSYRTVKEENRNFLPPSQIIQIAENHSPKKLPQRVYYNARDKSVMVLFSKKEEYSYSVFINPYSGEVLKVRNNDRDFLSVALKLHRTLGIPYGHEIIKWSTVILVMMLISGIILWWPKTRRTRKQGFVIKWGASPKRLNYDLHKVLGFYVSWIVLFSALTGLMFAFKGFANFVHQAAGYNNSIVQKTPPPSDTTVTLQSSIAPIDLVWNSTKPQLYKKYASLLFVLPATKPDPILVRANPEKSTIYKTDFRYFDQSTSKEISGAYVWGKYSDASTAADYIKRMNYDIHTGAMFGLPGRIGLFFMALIVASLPITGIIFWLGRKKKDLGIKRMKGLAAPRLHQPASRSEVFN